MQTETVPATHRPPPPHHHKIYRTISGTLDSKDLADVMKLEIIKGKVIVNYMGGF